MDTITKTNKPKSTQFPEQFGVRLSAGTLARIDSAAPNSNRGEYIRDAISEKLDRDVAGADTKRITLTRRSKLGWDYCTTPIGVGSEIALPAKPDMVGTYRQIVKWIGESQDYQFCKSGGTYHTTSWFCRYGNEWRRIARGDDPFSDPVSGLEYEDEITVEIE